MKKLLVGVLLLFSMGCKTTLNGVLNVVDDTQVTHNGHSLMKLSAGLFETKIEIKRQAISISVKDGSPQSVEFKTNEKIDLPENGDFRLSQSQTGLNYDIKGAIHTDREEVDRYWDWESCPISDGPYGPRWGRQRVLVVEYHTERSVSMDFVSSPVSFESQEEWNSVQRHIDGFCF